MIRPDNPRKLFVEGATELRTIPELMEANGFPWEQAGDTGVREFLVAIEDMGGEDNLLDRKKLMIRLKDPTTKHFGIILDADHDAGKKWDKLRPTCAGFFKDLPNDFPATGLIATNDRDQRLGVWIMPDNKSHGILETFLTFLVPDHETNPLRKFASEACGTATERGANFKPAHRDKAEIHTWLAWQDEPGQQLHAAVQQRILDPTSEYAAPFVRWFRELYEL